MSSGMTRVCTVLVRQADGDRGRDGEMMTAGEGTTLWTASVAELPDCTVTGESFEELEAAMRDRLLGLGRGRHGDGTLAQGNLHIELQWSVDDTETIGEADIQAIQWLED
ncbi:hypothetical protein [Corynebacterium variabile]|uniref:hypothetical protein n=1 Tax=Corynebacterium variabile TaxID=1727 RepID=UPI0028AC8CDF|nr:hypothetical protein [Corynebacterium variabile]